MSPRVRLPLCSAEARGAFGKELIFFVRKGHQLVKSYGKPLVYSCDFEFGRGPFFGIYIGDMESGRCPGLHI